MAPQKHAANAMEIDRLATQLAKDPHSKAFLPLAEEYCKVGMWEEAVSVLEDGLKHYPGFITAMVVLGRAYDQLKQPIKARAVLEGAINLSPENLRAHRILIKIYAAEGLTHDALKSCRVILDMNPKDEEALSVQASLGVEKAEQARDAVPPHTPFAVAQEPQAAPTLTRDSDIDKTSAGSGHTTSDHQLETAASTQGALRHADAIAQLEAWLHSLERQRRDRPISGTSDRNP